MSNSGERGKNKYDKATESKEGKAINKRMQLPRFMPPPGNHAYETFIDVPAQKPLQLQKP